MRSGMGESISFVTRGFLRTKQRIAMVTKNKSLVVLCAMTLATLLARGAEADPLIVPPPAEILAKLHKAHPRLLVSADDFVRLKERVGTDARLGEWHQKLRDQAERMLTEPPSRYEIPDGLRLLATSRRVLHRVYTLALLWRLDGDNRCAERAWQELLAAANFKDWNPGHFLDTAEMTHAFAVGYDWLYDVLSPEDRSWIRAAIIEKGLDPALAVYEHPAGTWVTNRFNWNQVCNGGIALGALAIADDEPDKSRAVLRYALDSI